MALLTLAVSQPRSRLPAPPVTFTVGGYKADFGSIQDAVTAAPEGGAVIRIRPGVYREVVHVDKPRIQMRGEGHDPAKVVMVFAQEGVPDCGADCPATLSVTAGDFYAEGLTIQNDAAGPGVTRAVRVSGDRAVLRSVRMIGRRGTLLAGSDGCTGCMVPRQYFSDCSVLSAVDPLSGYTKAVFAGCEIRGFPDVGTAQTRLRRMGFVLDSCRLMQHEAAPVLTPAAESPFSASTYLRGTDGWNPERVR